MTSQTHTPHLREVRDEPEEGKGWEAEDQGGRRGGVRKSTGKQEEENKRKEPEGEEERSGGKWREEGGEKGERGGEDRSGAPEEP